MALTRELNELVCRYDKYAELHRSVAMRADEVIQRWIVPGRSGLSRYSP